MTGQFYHDLATTTGMMFDEVFFAADAVEKGTASRFDSFPCDGQQQQTATAPVSPCDSIESSCSSAATSLTGKLCDIEHKYRVDPRVLGSGHHGSVRECVDRSTGRRRAVKSVRKSDPAVRPGRLVREIYLLLEMKHRGIVRLVDVFEDSECVHLVTDLCGGGELFDKIVERRSDEDSGRPCFAEDEAARIIHQILAAVSYMHGRGIVHRDLKPENILFETDHEDSPVKIIDFGLSRRHRPDREPPMSTTVGTLHYIAPEVLRNEYDKSCDLWSVGVVAYVLLCGYPPFDGDGNDEVREAVRNGRCRFPAAEWSGVSREARNFVFRLLRKNPRKRMTTEQALNHPWIVQWMANQIDTEIAATRGEAWHGSSSAEVMINGFSTRELPKQVNS